MSKSLVWCSIMKKILCVLISVVILIMMCCVSVSAEEEISVSAKSAVVICADTSEVVYSKNMNECLPMASTTKIMTSVLALEYGATDVPITMTRDMITVEGSSMGLLEGDLVSLKTLVKGMLLESGNDAANAVAHIVGGDVASFVVLMNNKAKEIGMMSTTFETPSGLDGDNHYSTAYDMALLGAYALKNPEFRAICSSEKEVVYYGNPPYRRVLTNHNRLLSSYDGAFGIKTGFTKKSGRCLVSAAQRDGKTLVAVTLNAPDDWNDHKKMLDYAFEKAYCHSLIEDLSDIRLPVVGGDNTSIAVELFGNASVTSALADYEYTDRILLSKFEYAPVYKGDIVGTAEFYNTDGKKICELPICAAESVQTAVTENTANINESKKGFFERLKELFG